MAANGGVVKAKLILDSSEFSSEWKKRIGELNARIKGPDFSGIKKELDDTAQGAKKTKENVDQINNSKFDKATSNLDELIRKVKGLQSSAKPLDIVVKPSNLDETIRKIRELGNQSKKSEEQVKQINNSRFDKLVSTLNGAINKMRSTASSGITNVKNSINSGLHSITFTSLQNKFSATIQSMKNTASAGVRSISNEFSSMQAGLTDIFATVAGGAGLSTLFSYGQGIATTKAMLGNTKSPEEAKDITDQYLKYTQASSTPDRDIQNLMVYTMQAAPKGQTFRTLAAMDAAAHSPNPNQRQELLRNFGQYLTGGYSEALFRGDLTPEQAEILKSAQTPEERVAAMEKVATTKGSSGLSTTFEGPLGPYNKAMVVTDTLILGLTKSFDKFLKTVEPLLDWFLGLDQGTKDLITDGVFLLGLLGMVGGAIRIFGEVIRPFIGIFKTLGSGALQLAGKLKDMIPTDKISSVLGKLKDVAGNGISSMGDKITQGLSGLKDKVSGPLNSVKDAIVNKFTEIRDYIQSQRSTGVTGGTTGTGGKSGGTNWGAVLGGIAIAAATIYITNAAIEYATGRLNQPTYTPTAGGQPLSPGESSTATTVKEQWWGTYNTSSLKGILPGFPIGLDVALQNWDVSRGLSEFLNPASIFKKVLPGTASAAGKGGKSSIMDDIFGSKGVLRGTPLAGLKWPSAGQILGKLMDVLLPKVPKLNWKAPNVSQILHGVWEKINPLNWKIPSVGQILGQTWEKINPLNWKIPGVGDFLSQTWQKINPLKWQIPTVGDILGIIRGIIPPFSWPWGPGGGTRASNVAGDVASRARTLLSRGPPRGPLTDMVSGEISSMSGLGQGNIASAMSKRFKGISAFTDIANGMADHLGYEFYMGDQKSNQQVWDSGTCNCYDGAQFLMTEANRKMGLGGWLQNGLWNGTAIPHTWSVIGGQPFDMAAMLLRGQWAPPSGPNNMTVAQFMTDIGPGLEYMAYEGHLKDPIDAVFDGGNCFDTTLGLMGMIEGLFGVPTEMVWGTYDGMSHVWLRAGGVDYDPTRRALANTYSPPPQGPGNAGSGGVHFHEGAIQLGGTFIGMEEYKKQIKDYAKQAFDEEARRDKKYRFGR
jgi:hypothetical protein